MPPKVKRILLIAGVAFLVLMGASGLLLYRTREIAASSYEREAGKWWAIAAGGYQDFANQIVSLKPDPASQPAVCHNAKVQLQNLNSLNIAVEVPSDYQDFHRAFREAIQTNKRYYREMLQFCAKGAEANGALLSSISSLGRDVEDSYRDAHRLMPEVGIEIEPGTYTQVNAQLSRIFLPPKAEEPSPRVIHVPRVVEVPRRGFSPDFPPPVGSTVVISTPRGGSVNLRESPSLQAARVEGREVVRYGERVLVLDRVGYWLFVETDDGYYGYIRWWYEGSPYVRP